MSDLELLQGRWRQVASSIDGAPEQAVPDGDEFAGALIAVFSGDAFEVLGEGGAVMLAGRFVIDEAAHALDWIDAFGPDAGTPLPAMYELTPTTLAFAAADSGAPRPTRVAPAPGVAFRRFVRVSGSAS